jgi:hypothetical protein
VERPWWLRIKPAAADRGEIIDVHTRCRERRQHDRATTRADCKNIGAGFPDWGIELQTR